MDALFFWLFSVIMIVSGIAVILNRNPVASLLCFVASIFAMSGLFVMLSAFFLAIIEILVTAGAVMVLFLFVIMLINVTEAEKIPRRKVWMAFSLALALGFILIVAKTLNATPGGKVNENDLTSVGFSGSAPITPALVDAQPAQTLTAPEDDTHQIGKLLFTTYVVPFEVTSLLLLVATIGVIVLCKQDDPKRSPRESIASEAPPRKEPALKS